MSDATRFHHSLQGCRRFTFSSNHRLARESARPGRPLKNRISRRQSTQSAAPALQPFPTRRHICIFTHPNLPLRRQPCEIQDQLLANEKLAGVQSGSRCSIKRPARAQMQRRIEKCKISEFRFPNPPESIVERARRMKLADYDSSKRRLTYPCVPNSADHLIHRPFLRRPGFRRLMRRHQQPTGHLKIIRLAKARTRQQEKSEEHRFHHQIAECASFYRHRAKSAITGIVRWSPWLCFTLPFQQ